MKYLRYIGGGLLALASFAGGAYVLAQTGDRTYYGPLQEIDISGAPGAASRAAILAYLTAEWGVTSFADLERMKISLSDGNLVTSLDVSEDTSTMTDTERWDSVAAGTSRCGSTVQVVRQGPKPLTATAECDAMMQELVGFDCTDIGEMECSKSLKCYGRRLRVESASTWRAACDAGSVGPQIGVVAEE